MRKFKKAPELIGKYLDLQIGSKSKIIRDNEILTGNRWAKFVDHGFLVEIEEPKPEPKTEPKSEPEPKPKKKIEPVVESAPEPEPEPEKEEEPIAPKKKRGRRKKSSK